MINCKLVVGLAVCLSLFSGQGIAQYIDVSQWKFMDTGSVERSVNEFHTGVSAISPNIGTTYTVNANDQGCSDQHEYGRWILGICQPNKYTGNPRLCVAEAFYCPRACQLCETTLTGNKADRDDWCHNINFYDLVVGGQEEIPGTTMKGPLQGGTFIEIWSECFHTDIRSWSAFPRGCCPETGPPTGGNCEYTGDRFNSDYEWIICNNNQNRKNYYSWDTVRYIPIECEWDGTASGGPVFKAPAVLLDNYVSVCVTPGFDDPSIVFDFNVYVHGAKWRDLGKAQSTWQYERNSFTFYNAHGGLRHDDEGSSKYAYMGIRNPTTPSPTAEGIRLTFNINDFPHLRAGVTYKAFLNYLHYEYFESATSVDVGLVPLEDPSNPGNVLQISFNPSNPTVEFTFNANQVHIPAISGTNGYMETVVFFVTLEEGLITLDPSVSPTPARRRNLLEERDSFRRRLTASFQNTMGAYGYSSCGSNLDPQTIGGNYGQAVRECSGQINTDLVAGWRDLVESAYSGLLSYYSTFRVDLAKKQLAYPEAAQAMADCATGCFSTAELGVGFAQPIARLFEVYAIMDCHQVSLSAEVQLSDFEIIAHFDGILENQLKGMDFAIANVAGWLAPDYKAECQAICLNAASTGGIIVPPPPTLAPTQSPVFEPTLSPLPTHEPTHNPTGVDPTWSPTPSPTLDADFNCNDKRQRTFTMGSWDAPVFLTFKLTQDEEWIEFDLCNTTSQLDTYITVNYTNPLNGFEYGSANDDASFCGLHLSRTRLQIDPGDPLMQAGGEYGTIKVECPFGCQECAGDSTSPRCPRPCIEGEPCYPGYDLSFEVTLRCSSDNARRRLIIPPLPPPTVSPTTAVPTRGPTARTGRRRLLHSGAICINDVNDGQGVQYIGPDPIIKRCGRDMYDNSAVVKGWGDPHLYPPDSPGGSTCSYFHQYQNGYFKLTSIDDFNLETLYYRCGGSSHEPTCTGGFAGQLGEGTERIIIDKNGNMWIHDYATSCDLTADLVAGAQKQADVWYVHDTFKYRFAGGQIHVLFNNGFEVKYQSHIIYVHFPPIYYQYNHNYIDPSTGTSYAHQGGAGLFGSWNGNCLDDLKERDGSIRNGGYLAGAYASGATHSEVMRSWRFWDTVSALPPNLRDYEQTIFACDKGANVFEYYGASVYTPISFGAFTATVNHDQAAKARRRRLLREYFSNERLPLIEEARRRRLQLETITVEELDAPGFNIYDYSPEIQEWYFVDCEEKYDCFYDYINGLEAVAVEVRDGANVAAAIEVELANSFTCIPACLHGGMCNAQQSCECAPPFSGVSCEFNLGLPEIDDDIFHEEMVNAGFYITDAPTLSPTSTPTGATLSPSDDPSSAPTFTRSPSASPTTAIPTKSPTDSPTYSPSDNPTKKPTRKPTDSPTYSPSDNPTLGPITTRNPTRRPTDSPTYSPSDNPSKKPTRKPTDSPTYGPTTDSPTTDAPTTASPTTASPTTASPTTSSPTTSSPTTSSPTTRSPTTAIPTTASPTTSSPTTSSPTTSSPTTSSPTTASPTTSSPTTDSPTTDSPTTSSPTTASPTTGSPTTDSPTTDSPTTSSPTTGSPTTDSPTTSSPTSSSPTTDSPTTASPTTASPTTSSPTTASPTTSSPTTASPTTSSPTTASPTTASPTTASPTTSSPTTDSPTTSSPTTASPTTSSPTTASPTTGSPTTDSPTKSPVTGTPTTSSPTDEVGCPHPCTANDCAYAFSQSSSHSRSSSDSRSSSHDWHSDSKLRRRLVIAGQCSASEVGSGLDVLVDPFNCRDPNDLCGLSNCVECGNNKDCEETCKKYLHDNGLHKCKAFKKNWCKSECKEVASKFKCFQTCPDGQAPTCPDEMDSSKSSSRSYSSSKGSGKRRRST